VTLLWRDTASTCIRSGVVTRTLIFHARVEVRPEETGPIYEAESEDQARVRHTSVLGHVGVIGAPAFLKAWAHRSAGWYEAGFQIAPQRQPSAWRASATMAILRICPVDLPTRSRTSGSDRYQADASATARQARSRSFARGGARLADTLLRRLARVVGRVVSPTQLPT